MNNSMAPLGLTQSPTDTFVGTSRDSSPDTRTEKEPYVVRSRDFGFIPIPKRLQYHPNKPFKFGLVINILFGVASTFTVANLYYCQPLLIQLSESFHVTYEEVSLIPTLIQAGYAVGLVLITPLGDIVRRRPLVLALVLISSSLTIGCAITSNLRLFEALGFLIGFVSIVPQILIPLAADLAPPERRGSALAIVLAGLMLGILVARVLAGVIGNFTSWRVVYLLAIGVQSVVLAGAYAVLPDYPAKNTGLAYWRILWTMATYAVTEPVLIQASLVNVASSACFNAFWVTLTFLLGGAPYSYSTLVIGLFGLLGMLGVVATPLCGRLVDRLVPWSSALLATAGMLVFAAVQTAGGGINVSAVIIATFGFDVFRQLQQVSLSTTVMNISSEARSRMNAVNIFAIFIGQVMGTAVGTTVFVSYGWRALGVLLVGLCGFQIATLLIRGPQCARYTWFGYEGGLKPRKDPGKSGSEDEKSNVEARLGV
ncbi:membrane protein [Coniophora puteana RWD-64-598 SS2]|uniref:Membrane protein n=1 Tax=Coniophora puteana (strain RWD-64-598) TaxID=741705 RepID=A0A5M3MR54_CONPW|nr:uncharacterized protein CONPUDRAFT_104961 [Coniophora puteana RWD-64-598 SS2]EIW81546.1 membrane protein [Coniophora puteana RWD-64-598 SS2]